MLVKITTNAVNKLNHLTIFNLRAVAGGMHFR